MTLFPQETLKNNIISKMIRHDPRLSLLSAVSGKILPGMTVLAAIYAGLNFLVPGLSTVTINGIPQKDTLSILSRTIQIFLFGVIGRICFKAFLANRTSKDLQERTDEEVIIDGSRICFVFRLRYFLNPESRLIVNIPLGNIHSIERDAFTQKIVFRGSFVTAFAEHFYSGQSQYPTLGTLPEFVVYDYFEPSLVKILQEEGWIPILPDLEVTK